MVSLKLTMSFFICVCVCVCVSTVDFWFAVTMRFWSSCLYIHMCVCVYSICVCVCVYIYTQDYFKLLVYFHMLHFQHPAFVLSSSHSCWLWYDIFVLVISYLCCMYLYQWAFPFIIFLLLTVAFSFALREIPLAFVVKLVWWCWILLAFAYL